MSRLLIIGETEKQKLAALKKHAEENVLTFDDVLDSYNKQKEPVGNSPEFRCVIPDDFTVVFSHELQPSGQIRHLSVSCPGEGRVPSIPAMKIIMHELGYKSPLEECYIYLEEYEVRNNAVNVIEFVK